MAPSQTSNTTHCNTHETMIFQKPIFLQNKTLFVVYPCNIPVICNTLQHTTTHSSHLQHTATHYNTFQSSATHCNTLQHIPVIVGYYAFTHLKNNTLQHTLQHTATHPKKIVFPKNKSLKKKLTLHVAPMQHSSLRRLWRLPISQTQYTATHTKQ